MSGSSLVPYQKKKAVTTHPAIDSVNEIIQPLNFGFCEIEKIKDAQNEDPRPPYSPRKIKVESPRKEGERSNSKCLWLNNNSISSLVDLDGFLTNQFTNWAIIEWVNLSFNELTKIEPQLTELPNLKILYLHGNSITDIDEVEKLSCLNLKKLTLHGNPMVHIKGYRSLILAILPQLQEFDFSAVTKSDRMDSRTISKMVGNPSKKKKRPQNED